jgi:hypothetical protein
LSTGSTPGIPRHTGQVWVLGGAPKDVEQAQKILVLVFSWAWTSSPMTGSKFMSISVFFILEVEFQPGTKPQRFKY